MRERKPYRPTQGLGLARENLVTPDLGRFVYLERFASGCVVRAVTCYDSPAGWQLIDLRHLKREAAFEMLMESGLLPAPPPLWSSFPCDRSSPSRP